jgi:hypothetical protein
MSGILFFAPRRIFNSILALIFPRLLQNFNFLVAFNYSRPYLILPLPLICSIPFSPSLAFFILRCQPSSSLIPISFNSKTILSLKIHLLSLFFHYFLSFVSSLSLRAISIIHLHFMFWIPRYTVEFRVCYSCMSSQFYAVFFYLVHILVVDVLVFVVTS